MPGKDLRESRQDQVHYVKEAEERELWGREKKKEWDREING